MTVSSATSRISYTGNGATSVYAYTFYILDDDDLQVTVRNTSGSETTLTKTTDYTVSGVGSASGGNVTLVNASQAWLTGGFLTTSYVLTIRRVMTLTQTTDIRNGGAFLPSTHEDQFDRGIMIDQQLHDALARSLKLPETEAGTAAYTTLPTATNRASKYLFWDASGNPTAVSVVSSTTYTISAFIQTLIDDANAATARATLGIDGSSGAIATGDLANLAVSAAKLAANAVTSTKLDVDAITGQTALSDPAGADTILVHDSSSAALRKLTMTTLINGQTAKTSVVDADEIIIYDSAATLSKKVTIANVLANLPVHTMTSKTTPVAADEVIISDSAASWVNKRATVSSLRGALTGSVVQIQTTMSQTQSLALSTLMPWDDTIPQNTEGDELMTCAITPTSSSNLLIIEVVIFGGCENAANHATVALFQDSTANALAAVAHSAVEANESTVIPLMYKMTAGTTSATTFKIRAGDSVGGGGNAFRFNGCGSTGGDLGARGTSFIKITEVAV